MALCVMGRADCFLMLAGCGSLGIIQLRSEDPPEPQYVEKACEAAVKACRVFPLSIYFYDFGRVLEQAGNTAEAKQMLAEFLRPVESETLDLIEESVFNQRDVEAAVRHARRLVGIGDQWKGKLP